MWWSIAIAIGLTLLVLAVLSAVFRRYRPAMLRLTDEQGWRYACPKCRADGPLGETGYVRMYASGTKRTLLRCPACRRYAWMLVYRQPRQPDSPATRATPFPPDPSDDPDHDPAHP
ncbi:MAG: hypothetical protein ACK5WB_12285 [Phycisphaerales bacterium]|jgi:hypothetical protein|nr:hypothetical protein [Phycisphaeraceae bacterium]